MCRRQGDGSREPVLHGPRDAAGLLDGIGDYLDQAAPDRKQEMIAAIEARADQLAEVDADLAVDAAGAGAVRSR